MADKTVTLYFSGVVTVTLSEEALRENPDVSVEFAWKQFSDDAVVRAARMTRWWVTEKEALPPQARLTGWKYPPETEVRTDT